jgi:beta-xylosidase
MIEAVKLWNEPNNLSHWDFTMDPEWRVMADMLCMAADEVRRLRPQLPLVLGGISPIDAGFVELMGRHGVLDRIDAVGVHGFPLDWNNWTAGEWPQRIDDIRHITTRPVWVTETGISSFGHDHVQVMGIHDSARHVQ